MRQGGEQLARCRRRSRREAALGLRQRHRLEIAEAEPGLGRARAAGDLAQADEIRRRRHVRRRSTGASATARRPGGRRRPARSAAPRTAATAAARPARRPAPSRRPARPRPPPSVSWYSFCASAISKAAGRRSVSFDAARGSLHQLGDLRHRRRRCCATVMRPVAQQERPAVLRRPALIATNASSGCSAANTASPAPPAAPAGRNSAPPPATPRPRRPVAACACAIRLSSVGRGDAAGAGVALPLRCVSRRAGGTGRASCRSASCAPADRLADFRVARVRRQPRRRLGDLLAGDAALRELRRHEHLRQQRLCAGPAAAPASAA